MRYTKAKFSEIQKRFREDESGSAMVIALLVMILLMGFVALAVSRTNSETVSAANDEAETKAFEASNACLEVMTRNFNKVFETKLTFSAADQTRLQTQPPPGFTDYAFNQVVTQTEDTKDVVMTGELFQGLNARRDAWKLDCTSRSTGTGVEVALSRTFLNNRIPIFQFGIFYDDDLEFHPGPRFDFGGRVHSNGSIYMMAGTGLYFSSKVSSADPKDLTKPRSQIFTDISKNGTSYSAWGENVFLKNASGVYVQLRHDMGSALNNPVNGTPVSTAPTAYTNANWPTYQNQFQGNLLAHVGELQLPIKINSDISVQNLDNVEIVKRGKNLGDIWNDGTGTVSTPNIVAVTAPTSDDKITAAERYYNKTGIRINLADSKEKLPGCATATGTAVTTPCGVRLDGDSAGQTAGTTTGVRGYLPRAQQGSPAYQATAINGDRFYTGNKETWIKVETVVYNPVSITYDTQDITQDFLSLGVTQAPPSNLAFSITDSNYNTNNIDGRSIIKLQRYVIPGAAIGGTSSIFMTSIPVGTDFYNVVAPAVVTSGQACTSGSGFSTTGRDNGTVTAATAFFPNGFANDNRAHMRNATLAGITGVQPCVVPFPINMFDTREGLYNDTDAVFNATTTYAGNVPWAGVMSMVDIDVANLKRFLDGNFDSNMPGGTPYATATGHVLRGSDVPQNNGWVMYVSDRRGDYDFDGEYDMEDVYGNNDGNLQAGEDVNKNGTLQAEYTNEAVRYNGANSNTPPDIAAVFDHKYYRRGVRLTNAVTLVAGVKTNQLPGGYDSTTPANTKGFAFATENGVYVLGDYNATHVTNATGLSASTDYRPNDNRDVPASIAADAVTVLSNNWNDAQSFVFPFALNSRPAGETTQRFAMLAGDTITTTSATPNQGGGDLKMNGGVHNFLRFLERWDTRLNYSGSLINLFNSHNNSAPFKCCNHVYDPPERNWIFDATFLDVNRLPPGTPYFQNIQMTGFQRVN